MQSQERRKPVTIQNKRQSFVAAVTFSVRYIWSTFCCKYCMFLRGSLLSVRSY